MGMDMGCLAAKLMVVWCVGVYASCCYTDSFRAGISKISGTFVRFLTFVMDASYFSLTRAEWGCPISSSFLSISLVRVKFSTFMTEVKIVTKMLLEPHLWNKIWMEPSYSAPSQCRMLHSKIWKTYIITSFAARLTLFIPRSSQNFMLSNALRMSKLDLLITRSSEPKCKNEYRQFIPLFFFFCKAHCIILDLGVGV